MVAEGKRLVVALEGRTLEVVTHVGPKENMPGVTPEWKVGRRV